MSFRMIDVPSVTRCGSSADSPNGRVSIRLQTVIGNGLQLVAAQAEAVERDGELVLWSREASTMPEAAEVLGCFEWSGPMGIDREIRRCRKISPTQVEYTEPLPAAATAPAAGLRIVAWAAPLKGPPSA